MQRYADVFRIKIEKQNYFITSAMVQLFFACVVVIKEFIAGSRQFPMTIFPMEHQASWGKSLLYFGAAIISILVAWSFTSKRRLHIFLPSLKPVLLFAAFPTLTSILTTHYLSVLGWCCESPFTFYFGFPFSFLRGVGGPDYSLMSQYSNYSFFAVLRASELQISWQFLPYPIFLNALFWSNMIFSFLSSIFWLFPKEKYSRRIKGPAEFVKR
jgi:hypothetical protein